MKSILTIDKSIENTTVFPFSKSYLCNFLFCYFQIKHFKKKKKKILILLRNYSFIGQNNTKL